MTDPALDNLTAINTTDLVSAFGAGGSLFWQSILGAVFHRAARRFASQVLAYDSGVDRLGLRAGAVATLQSYNVSLRVVGASYLPDSGPLLLLSNHPGLTDTISLFASLPRSDLRIVAAERPFLRALPATSRHLIYVPEASSNRLEVLRGIAAHLRGGGAVLTFPAGEIEPDPASMPGAVESLARWSDSIGFFARLVPETAIVPAFVSGVIARPSLRHPLTRLRRRQLDRERLAAALQLLVMTYAPSRWTVRVQVRFYPPLLASTLAPLRDPARITQTVIDYIRTQLTQDEPLLE